MIRRVSVGLVLLALLVGCGGSSVPLRQSIVGTWEDPETKQRITYAANGVQGHVAPYAAACWRVEGEDTLIVKSTASANENRMGATVDGDALTLKAAIATRVMKRVDANPGLTPEQQAHHDKSGLTCPAP